MLKIHISGTILFYSKLLTSMNLEIVNFDDSIHTTKTKKKERKNERKINKRKERKEAPAIDYICLINNV